MRGHLAVGMTGCCNLQLGTHHQRVGELPLRCHGVGRNGAAVGGDKVHQPKADALHPGVGCDLKSV